VRRLREAPGSPRFGPPCSTPRSVCFIQCAAHSRMLTPHREPFSYPPFDDPERFLPKLKADTILCASSGFRADGANARAGRTPQDSAQERVRHRIFSLGRSISYMPAQARACSGRNRRDVYHRALVHAVIVRCAPCLLAIWLMRRQVRIYSGLRPSPGGFAAALSLRRGTLVSRAREEGISASSLLLTAKDGLTPFERVFEALAPAQAQDYPHILQLKTRSRRRRRRTSSRLSTQRRRSNVAYGQPHATSPRYRRCNISNGRSSFGPARSYTSSSLDSWFGRAGARARRGPRERVRRDQHAAAPTGTRVGPSSRELFHNRARRRAAVGRARSRS
jgi:hypothetical protein